MKYEIRNKIIKDRNLISYLSSLISDSESGFTLIELLVALAILAVVIILMLMGQGFSLQRGEDARRKSDLAKFKVAFEDYYNDHNCYPQPELLASCNSTDLAPYISKVPCDPRTKAPYPYYWDASCGWYAAYTTLSDKTDPVIATLGCSPTCGVPGKPYNYVQTNGKLSPSQIADIISAGGAGSNEPGGIPTPPPGGTPTPSPTPSGTPTPTPTASPTPTPTPSPSPTPTPSGGGSQLACTPSGQCNIYDDPAGSGCPSTYADPTTCQAACANPANRCAR